jgi:tetratricopeptide (TPR) repeat protein
LRALVDADSRTALDRLEKFLEAQGRAEEAAALLPAAAGEGDDFAVADLVSRWSQNRPGKALDLLERCRRTGRTKAVFLSVRRLLRRPGPSASRRMAEEYLALLAEGGSSAAQLMLALWRLEQWQDQEPAGKEAVPSDIVVLLQQALRDQAEACRLLGQHALLAGDVSEAARCFRGAVDAGHYTVLADLAPLVVDDSREDARLLRDGLEADGSASPPW